VIPLAAQFGRYFRLRCLKHSMVSWSTLTFRTDGELRRLRDSLWYLDNDPKHTDTDDRENVVYGQYSGTTFFEDMSFLNQTLPLWDEAAILRASNTSDRGQVWYISINPYSFSVEDFFHFAEVEEEHGLPKGSMAANKAEEYSGLPVKVAVSTP